MNKKQTEKRIEQDKLKDIRSITITLEASEGNLQRIAALLLFADHLEPVVTVKPTLLPWEDPDDPRFQKPPELEIDYEMVRRTIARHLIAFVDKNGIDRAKAVLKDYGGDGLAKVPQDNLVDLAAHLERSLAQT